MNQLKIGILREDKRPIDRRVVLTPKQASKTHQKPEIEIKVETSNVRAYLDEEYKSEGLPATNDLSDCDVLLGVKEVPVLKLMPDKTYFFFSHTIKEQPYNRGLLQEVLKKNIRLIDWECLTNAKGQRLIAFGRYAGIVGAYNAILTYGKRFKHFDLRPANTCHDLEDLKTEYSKVDLPAIKIVITGGGRVAKGAIEVLNGIGIKEVSPHDFLSDSYDYPVYTQLEVNHYNKRRDGEPFEMSDFFQNPKEFVSDFLKFAHAANILIGAAYWDPDAPTLFTREEATSVDFSIEVIGDITMDIEGSIPGTLRASTIDEPNYDYNPHTGMEEPAFSNSKNITMMAVDNLPCELPRDASRDFGNDFINYILDPLLGNDPDKIIERGTIARDGQLMPDYSYLQAYVDGE